MAWRDVFPLLPPAFSAVSYAGVAALLFARSRRSRPLIWRGRPLRFPGMMAAEFLCVALMFAGIAVTQAWFDHEDGLLLAASALPCVGLGTSWVVRRRLVRAAPADQGGRCARTGRRKRAPRSAAVTLPGLGHNAHVDDPAAVLGLLDPYR